MVFPLRPNAVRVFPSLKGEKSGTLGTLSVVDRELGRTNVKEKDRYT